MKYTFVFLLLFVGVAPVMAFNPLVTELSESYEVTTIDEAAAQTQVYLGELEGFPIMYEVTSDEPFVLQAKVQQRYMTDTDPVQFSLIAIRQNDRGGGVTEVKRLNPTSADWQIRKSSPLGMMLWESPEFSSTVEPGTYRVEISTPANEGKYLLSFGAEESSDGYFTSLAGVYRTQKFFGYSVFKMLSSSYVYYPLGAFLILFVMTRVWKHRGVFSHHAT